MRNILKIDLVALIAVLLFIFGCGGNGLPTEDMTNYNKLKWLQGIWKGDQGNADIYESWVGVNYRIMEGISYTSKNGTRIYSQTMNLEQSNNKIYFIINPKESNKKITLKLKSVSDSSAIFVNKDSVGYPKKIVYNKLPGERMKVHIDGKTPESSTNLIYEKTRDY